MLFRSRFESKFDITNEYKRIYNLRKWQEFEFFIEEQINKILKLLPSTWQSMLLPPFHLQPYTYIHSTNFQENFQKEKALLMIFTHHDSICFCFIPKISHQTKLNNCPISNTAYVINNINVSYYTLTFLIINLLSGFITL